MNISLDTFKVDLFLPIVQSTATLGVVKLLNHIGQTAMNHQTVALVSTVAATVASFANNLFDNIYVQYASIPAGIGAGILAHRLFYSQIPLDKVLDVKGFLIITAVLSVVKYLSSSQILSFKMSKGESVLNETEILA